nr:UDP-N-acetylmuramate dehydrogenase [Desulfoprunum benzoelyticum]
MAEPVQWDCPLAGYTSFAIGGPAEALVKVQDRRELATLLEFLRRTGVPWRIIGKGTNILVRDEGFAGVIILLGDGFRQLEFGPCRSGRCVVAIGSGCSLAKAAMVCMDRGLTGLEFAGGIPGTVGGAVIMNAGAWGGEMAAVIRTVTVLDPDGEQILSRDRLHFGYRCWRDFPELCGRAVVVAVELGLMEDDPEEIRRRHAALQARRRAGQPSGQGNAGSFFKNPAHAGAGRLIEAAGLKGARIGGAMVSERHANFLVNTGGATAADVLALMRLVQEKVRQDSGVELEPEVHFL